MTDNVFAPPRSNVAVNTGPEELWDLSWKDLRNLYYASVNIRALGVLNVIGVAILSLGFLAPAREATSAMPIYVFLGVACAVSLLMAWTAFARPRWGRWFGIVMLVLGLLNFPLGTLISIIGLIAYVRARRLFGPDKILHKDLAEVFKQRKAEKK